MPARKILRPSRRHALEERVTGGVSRNPGEPVREVRDEILDMLKPDMNS